MNQRFLPGFKLAMFCFASCATTCGDRFAETASLCCVGAENMNTQRNHPSEQKLTTSKSRWLNLTEGHFIGFSFQNFKVEV
jgi:hypothetical protein